MIVDTSALIAILFDESEKSIFLDKLAAANTRRICAISVLEASIVLQARVGETGRHKLHDLLAAMAIEEVSFTPDLRQIAEQGFERFGKGRHKAGLNFGDCISYALARSTGEPLLFKGDDFSHTDLQLVRFD